jgi:cation:H+ antiporter
MSPLVSVLVFTAGLIVLYFGAESLLRGAVRLARAFGISPLVIGMTLIGFGTSAPELTVNLSAAAKGNTALALGNVVGSNIANIGLILGLAALIRPLTVQMRLLVREVPIVLGVSLALWGMVAWGEGIGRREGVVLLLGFAAMSVYTYRSARREPAEVQHEVGSLFGNGARPVRDIALVLLGLAGLAVGAELMVRAAIELARAAGVSDLLIGLTIVAIGTSLPEVASSVLASWRGEADIAVGNVVGSNIFNILLILGATAMVQPLPADSELVTAHLPIMVAFTVALVPLLLRSRRINRAEGVLLLLAYAGYLAWQAAEALSR